LNKYGKGGFLPLAASSLGKDLPGRCRSRTDEIAISSPKPGPTNHAGELGDLVCHSPSPQPSHPWASALCRMGVCAHWATAVFPVAEGRHWRSLSAWRGGAGELLPRNRPPRCLRRLLRWDKPAA